MRKMTVAFMTCSAVENDAAGKACWFQTTPPYGRYPGGDQIVGRDGKQIKGAVVVFDERSVGKVVAAFKEAAKAKDWPGILVDQDHFSRNTSKPSTALAWARDIRVGADGSIWTKWEFTAKGRELYEGKMLINRSPVLDLEQLSAAVFAPTALTSIGMTNAPYFKGLSPLAAAREVNNNKGEIQMDKDILSALGLAEGASKDDVLAAIQALKDREVAATATATDATKKQEAAEAKCRGFQCDAFIAAHKGQIADEGKFREAYLKAPEATEAAFALFRTAEKPSAARLSARDAKTPATTPGTEDGVKAKIAARSQAVNAYMTAHPGSTNAEAWCACRLADPDTFAD